MPARRRHQRGSTGRIDHRDARSRGRGQRCRRSRPAPEPSIQLLLIRALVGDMEQADHLARRLRLALPQLQSKQQKLHDAAEYRQWVHGI